MERRTGPHGVRGIEHEQGATIRKPKLDICIIDDEVVVCKRLQQALENDGHTVETFVDSRSAVERIAAKRFDVVVTDIRMDNIDGMEVLDAIVKKGERTKVVMITGYATIELAREATLKGAFDFLSKPFRPADLREVLARAAESLKKEPA
jgi:DNA-binding NtrC family response regulator